VIEGNIKLLRIDTQEKEKTACQICLGILGNQFGGRICKVDVKGPEIW